MTTFLFLRITHDLPELPRTAVIRGEPRIRPPTLIPVPVRSHFRGFARPRYQSRRITSLGLRRESSVTIDVHGSLDRVKDVSSFRAALLRRHLEECVRLAHADDVPLLILPEDTCCRRCVCLPGNEPLAGETDRPRLALFRPPAKADGILRIRVPFTVTTRARATRRLAPSRHRHPHRLPAHAAHTFSPWLGTMCFGGHCKRPSWHYPGGTSESRTPFEPRCDLSVILANPRLGLTTQASQRGSVCAAFRES
jgi:hypothetical protein